MSIERMRTRTKDIPLKKLLVFYFYPCPIDAKENPIDPPAGHVNSAATHFRYSNEVWIASIPFSADNAPFEPPLQPFYFG